MKSGYRLLLKEGLTNTFMPLSPLLYVPFVRFTYELLLLFRLLQPHTESLTSTKNPETF